MAGKIPKPWYRASKKTWYVCLDGLQVPLGKDKDGAFAAFHKIMIERGVGVDLANVDRTLTVGDLVTMYLADAERRLAKQTVRVTRRFLETFAEQFGKTRASQVRRVHVEQWIRRHPQWGSTSECLAKTRLVTLFAWGVEHGVLAINPIKGIPKPPQRSRGASAVITPEQFQLLIAHAEPCFPDVLITLWETGARPGEVTGVEAREFDPVQGIWLLTKHKNAHKGQSRVVHLTPAVVTICERLAGRYPHGPLYRTRQGTPYGWCGLSKRLRWLTRRIGLPDTITVYGLRHSFATDALAKGVPNAQVAELLGHSGTSMLHKHYAHLTAKSRALKDALAQVR